MHSILNVERRREDLQGCSQRAVTQEHEVSVRNYCGCSDEYGTPSILSNMSLVQDNRCLVVNSQFVSQYVGRPEWAYRGDVFDYRRSRNAILL
jgi:hypothetical protein